MRRALSLLPFVLVAAAASAEPLRVAKGNWQATSDVYFNFTVDGETVDIPSEHDSINECWGTDEDVTIDESMANVMGECVSTGSRAKAHSFDMDLSCNFDGVPMSGGASFAVSRGGESFSGRIFLSGEVEGAPLEAEGLILGHRTGVCTGGN